LLILMSHGPRQWRCDDSTDRPRRSWQEHNRCAAGGAPRRHLPRSPSEFPRL